MIMEKKKMDIEDTLYDVVAVLKILESFMGQKANQYGVLPGMREVQDDFHYLERAMSQMANKVQDCALNCKG